MTESSQQFNYIDVELMEKSCHPFAVELFSKNKEPMAQFQDHDTALLESALANPQQSFGGKDLYPSLREKAAILYYGLIKNHPFSNGNKRTATATLLAFLHINGHWIRGDSDNEDYLVDLAIRVAKSEGHMEKDKFLAEINGFLLEKMCKWDDFKKEMDSGKD